jgi:tetratricopeptide (TPR) repeat protein
MTASPLSPKDAAGWELWQKAIQAGNSDASERFCRKAYALFAQHPLHPPGLAAVALWRGNLAMRHNDPASALPLLEEAAAYLHDQPPTPLSAQAFSTLGQAHQQLNHLTEARNAYEQALARYLQLDDALGQANQQLAIGQLLRNEPESALPYLESAAAYWESQPASLIGAYAFTALGDVHRQLRQLPKAAQAYERALTTFQQIGNWQGMIDRWLDLALTYRDQGRTKPAIAVLDEAIALAERNSDYARLKQVLLHRGFIRQAYLQQYKEALADYLRVIELGGAEDEAFAWMQASGVYELLDRLPEAIAAAERALAHYRAVDNLTATAACYARLGDCYVTLRQFDQAEAAYQQALALHERSYDQLGQTQTWQQLAALSWERGQSEEALARYRRALRLAEQQNDVENAAGCCESLATLYETLDLPDQAATYYGLAARYREMSGSLEGQVRASIAQSTLMADTGRYDEALAGLSAKLPVVEASGDRLLLVQLHVALSDLAARRKDPQPAVDHAQAAQRLYESLGLARLAAINALRLGQAYDQLNRLTEAEASFAKSLQIAEQHELSDQAQTARVSLAWAQLRQSRYDEARISLQNARRPDAEGNPFAGYAIHVGLGVVAEKVGDAVSALAEFQNALTYLDRFRIAFAMPDLPIELIGNKAHLYQRVVLMLWRAGRHIESFARTEEARSRALLAFLGFAVLADPVGVPHEVMNNERHWLHEVRRLLLQLQHNPFDGAALSGLRQAHQQLAQLWDSLGASEYAHMRQGEPVTWEALRAYLSIA